MAIQLYGTVEHGRHDGRKIGFPTINIPNSIHVDPGIYVGTVFIHGVQYGCVIYVGTRRREVLEAHVFDFDHEMYGVLVMVRVLAKIRDDKVFGDQAELHATISRDCAQAREYILNNRCLQE